MNLYILTTNDPAFNLAFEEQLLNTSDTDTVMLWRNHPTVVCGCNQNLLNEVDLPYLKQNGIDAVRRITGGGTVYHDLGNINFSFITDYHEGDFGNFAVFCAPVLEYLRSLGIDAHMSGRNDLLAGELKFSGNAQTVRKNRILHHGTLLFDTNLSVLSHALLPDPEKLSTKGIASVRSRVTNLRPLLRRDMTADAFFDGLAAFFTALPGCTLCQPEQSLTEAAKTQTEQKYRSEEWLFGKSPAYTFRNRKRFNGGTVELQLNVKNAVIEHITVFGDYFFSLPSDQFCDAFRHTKHTPKAVKSVLEKLPVQKFFHGMTKEQILSLFF